MTLFVANGEICSVAKADCPTCRGVGWRFTECEERNGMIGSALTVCNCVEVRGRSCESAEGK